jgi:hypothetical protein
MGLHHYPGWLGDSRADQDVGARPDGGEMKIATQTQHRALAFIEACGKSGYDPAKWEVGTWLEDPGPADGPRDEVLGWSHGLSQQYSDDESDLEHLEHLGWISSLDERVRLTDLGRAILHSAERGDLTEPEASAVILDSQDPFAYAKLVGHLTKAGAGLLVDPYFRLGQLMAMLSGTTISRVLISKQHKSSKVDRAELKIALDSASLPRPIQIRASADTAIHDRLIVGENGEVWTLGASLNSVGHVNTMIIPVPEAGATALRVQAEGLWGKAEPVGRSQGSDSAPDGQDPR